MRIIDKKLINGNAVSVLRSMLAIVSSIRSAIENVTRNDSRWDRHCRVIDASL